MTQITRDNKARLRGNERFCFTRRTHLRQMVPKQTRKDSLPSPPLLRAGDPLYILVQTTLSTGPPSRSQSNYKTLNSWPLLLLNGAKRALCDFQCSEILHLSTLLKQLHSIFQWTPVAAPPPFTRFRFIQPRHTFFQPSTLQHPLVISKYGKRESMLRHSLLRLFLAIYSFIWR